MDFGGVVVEPPMWPIVNQFGIGSIICFQIIPKCRDPSNDGDVSITHLSVPSASNHFAKELMEIQSKSR